MTQQTILHQDVNGRVFSFDNTDGYLQHIADHLQQDVDAMMQERYAFKDLDPNDPRVRHFHSNGWDMYKLDDGQVIAWTLIDN